MNNMRRGFTMIELIFVIVIIGILAAVAIPKLAATRGDAEGAKIANELATCVNDAGGDYLKNETFANGLNSNACTTGLVSASGTPCFKATGVNTTGVLTIESASAGTSVACDRAIDIAAKNGMSAAAGGTQTHQF